MSWRLRTKSSFVFDHILRAEAQTWDFATQVLPIREVSSNYEQSVVPWYHSVFPLIQYGNFPATFILVLSVSFKLASQPYLKHPQPLLPAHTHYLNHSTLNRNEDPQYPLWPLLLINQSTPMFHSWTTHVPHFPFHVRSPRSHHAKHHPYLRSIAAQADV